MTKTKRNLKPLASALLATSFLLAACSSDTASDAEGTAASEVTPEADESTETTETAGASDDSETSEIGYLGSYTLDDAEFGTQVTVTVDGTTRTIVANALPDHETGEFPNAGNPNTISEQDVSYEYTTEPSFTGGETPVRTTGVSVNGVKFEPATAETVSCDSGETYRVEALQDLYDLGLDFNNAHVQPTGEYHYHGISELLADAYSTEDDLVHVGFAADGFMMYYSKSGAYSSGYELSTQTRVGTDCVASQALGGGDTEVEGTIPDGVYGSDWVWSDEAGDLDACNGVEIDGTYAYIITNEFPFISRCLNGDVEADGGPGGGDAPEGESTEGAAPAQGNGPDLTEAAASLGVTIEELQAALGGPPPDFEAAAETLGVTVDELQSALPSDPNAG